MYVCAVNYYTLLLFYLLHHDLMELFLRSKYEENLQDLDGELCKEWLMAMFHYQRTGEVLENINLWVKSILRQQIKEREWDKKNYDDACEKQRLKALKRWHPEEYKSIQQNATVCRGIPQNANSNSNNNIIKKEIIKEKKINRFEEFWNAYPLKKWKKKAEERYNTALKNWVSEDLLITKAKEYAEECRIKNTELKYIKRPEGWINGWRYEDTYITAKPKQVKSEDKPYDFTQKPTLIRPKLPWITNLKKEY